LRALPFPFPFPFPSDSGADRLRLGVVVLEASGSISSPELAFNTTAPTKTQHKAVILRAASRHMAPQDFFCATDMTDNMTESMTKSLITLKIWTKNNRARPFCQYVVFLSLQKAL
jgi:hypothetical protein